MPILDPNALIYKPYARVNCLKTIPFTAAHTYIVHIWQNPTPSGSNMPIQPVSTSKEPINLCSEWIHCFSFIPYYPSDLKSLSPPNAVKICAMNVQTWSTRNGRLCNAAPTSPPSPPPLSFPDQCLMLRYCHVRRGSVLSLCVLLILLWFPVGKTR